MFYTNRRANVPTQGTNWCYGTRIGVAVSTDHGKNWNYVGALDLEFERGRNTFWAPHVVYDKGDYPFYCSIGDTRVMVRDQRDLIIIQVVICGTEKGLAAD